MTVYYVTADSTGGRDGTTVANSWTLAEAASATAGDEVRLCGTPFNLIGANTWVWNNSSPVGVLSNPIKILGYNSDGTSEAGITINGSGMDSSTDILNVSASTHLLFKNVRITAARRFGVRLSNDPGITFIACQIDSCLSHGIYTTSYGRLAMLRTRINANGGRGIYSDDTVRGVGLMIDCVVDHNTSDGVCVGVPAAYMDKPSLIRCRIYRNGGKGVIVPSGVTNGPITIDHCVIFANTSDGINLPSAIGQSVIQNSIISDNGGYGINLNGATLSRVNDIRNIGSYGNTSGHSSLGSLLGDGSIGESPEFVRTTDGDEDLRATNPNYARYLDLAGGRTHFMIGALQPEASAGGGGLGLNMASMGVM